MRSTLLAAGVAATIAIAGCGSSSHAATTPTPTGQSFNATGDAHYTQQQVARLARLRSTDGGISWQHAGCDVAVIMTTRAEVQTYASAGDPVVTNPAGNVGVKFAPEPGCRQKLLAALAKVP